MLVIRYLRIGKKNQPSFKIVVTDKRKPPRGGRSVEVLGFNNPLTKKKNIDAERAKYWISKGAQPSASVYNLLVELKIIDGKKIATHAKSKKKIETASTSSPQVAPAVPAAPVAVPTEVSAAPAPVVEAPKEEQPKP